MSKSQQVEEQVKVLRWIAERPEEVEMLTKKRKLDYLIPIYLYLSHGTGMMGYTLERLLFQGFAEVVEKEGMDAVIDEVMQRAEEYHKAMTGEEGAEGKTDECSETEADSVRHPTESRA